MKYLKHAIGLAAITTVALVPHYAKAAEKPMNIGHIKNENVVIVTNKTMMAKKIAGDFANYTLYINDKTTINGETYYRVQTSEDINNAIGYVRAADLEIIKVVDRDNEEQTITFSNSTKIFDTPAGTERQIIDRAARNETMRIDEAIKADGAIYMHGTLANGTTGWIKKEQESAAAAPKTVKKNNNKEETKEEVTLQTVKPEPTEVSVPGAAVTHTTVSSTLKDALIKQMTLTPKPQYSNGVKWKDAHKDMVVDYLDTEALIKDNIGKYQFLVLNEPQGFTADQLNILLQGKGILEGQGEAFKTASEKYHVNEIYLISHAFLETAEGESKLARGVKVKGEDQDKLYYNMFGVGAYDKNALKYGAKYAANVGWDTPAKAIIGGAEFISKGYLTESQNTLYTMRWNPQSPGDTQYATDIMWAAANANYIAGFYQKLGIEGGKYHFIHYSK